MKALIAMSGGVDSSAAAVLMRAAGRWLLQKGLDASKDQSYVLYTLTQAQLAMVRFPVGALTKPEQWATAVQTGPDELRMVFDEPQRAVTPGQAVVLYDGDTVIGGGTIER